MNNNDKTYLTSKLLWLLTIILSIVIISILHYSTPTMKWQYHLLYMQAYFIPILLSAFQFGLKGGILSSIAVTIFYFPHIMLQWGGLVEENLMRFLQIVLFNVIGYLTGLKAQHEMNEKERLQQLSEQLDKNYAELKIQSHKLVDVEEQLRHSDRLAVMGELSASLAHEVRNPLGAIRGAVEIIRDETPPESKQFEFANILIEETKRLNEVVENYLNFAGKRSKNKVDYEINEIIKNSILLLENQAIKKNIKLIYNPFNGMSTINGDPTELRQIVINLFLNALESIEGEGEVILTLNKLPENGNFIFTIADSGVGINEQEIKNLFKPFYSTKETGSGLGLPIIKRICENNSWTIEVASEPKVGTEFKLTIPANKS